MYALSAVFTAKNDVLVLENFQQKCRYSAFIFRNTAFMPVASSRPVILTFSEAIGKDPCDLMTVKVAFIVSNGKQPLFFYISLI